MQRAGVARCIAQKSIDVFGRMLANSHGHQLHVATRAVSGADVATHSKLHVQSNFDSGNIEVVELSQQGKMKLRIKPDPYCESDKAAHFHIHHTVVMGYVIPVVSIKVQATYQTYFMQNAFIARWFNYRVSGARGTALQMDLLNAGEASYPAAWKDYQACASYDLSYWFRVPTSYLNGVLTISHTPEHDSVQYAYFAPYTQDRHARLVHRMQTLPDVRLEVLGQSVEGRDLDLLTVGQPSEAKLKIWVIARQHPGETQAEYFVEGLLERLTCRHDAVARKLLAGATFYIIPNMCPEAIFVPMLPRSTSTGPGLIHAPNASPEVFHALAKMRETGVDFMLDVHGDEELPHCFIAGINGIPKWGDRLKSLQEDFCEAFKRASPEFQTRKGYPTDAPGQANLTLCSKQIGEQFDCLSLTLEMPFKDSADLPEPKQGWSPERCKGLGAAVLPAIAEVLPKLR